MKKREKTQGTPGCSQNMINYQLWQGVSHPSQQ